MNFEQAMKSEVESIPGLENKVFPMVAPESVNTPFLIYRKKRIEYTKTLDGFTGNADVDYDIFLASDDYATLQSLNTLLTNKLQGFLSRQIGSGGPTIMDLVITQLEDVYDQNVDKLIAQINIKASY